MKIQTFRIMHLRNNEHFQFQTGFKELIELFTAIGLKIETLFSMYLLLYIKENEAFNVIRKSQLSDDLVDADIVRDNTFKGMSKYIESATRHFRPEVREAATRVKAAFNYYGNLAIKPYNGQTADTYSLIDDLTGKYASDVATIGMSEWVTELKANNDAFNHIKDSQYTEEAAKPLLKMKQERAEVDAAYNAITERINSLMVVEGEANYSNFVNELNKRVESYSNIIAIRKGKARKPTDTVEPK